MASGVCSAPGTGRGETSELEEPCPAEGDEEVPQASRSGVFRCGSQSQDEESSPADGPTQSVDLE